MSDILERILAVKRQEIQAAAAALPVGELRAAVRDVAACRDFYQAISQRPPRGVNVIAEIKKASPSAGLIRADFDPLALARIYQRAGAEALSILTDEQFFQGRLEYITAVKAQVGLPILRKDFIIDAYQVYQARLAGADAVLLIAEALAPRQVAELADLANDLGMTVLLEVHEAASLAAVQAATTFPQAPNRLLGVNNRNLKTMQVDLATSEKLAAVLKGRGGLVAESGIKTRADVQRLAQAGFSGVLIGETLMRSDDVAAKFAELFG